MYIFIKESGVPTDSLYRRTAEIVTASSINNSVSSFVLWRRDALRYGFSRKIHPLRGQTRKTFFFVFSKTDPIKWVKTVGGVSLYGANVRLARCCKVFVTFRTRFAATSVLQLIKSTATTTSEWVTGLWALGFCVKNVL